MRLFEIPTPPSATLLIELDGTAWPVQVLSWLQRKRPQLRPNPIRSKPIQSNAIQCGPKRSRSGELPALVCCRQISGFFGGRPANRREQAAKQTDGQTWRRPGSSLADHPSGGQIPIYQSASLPTRWPRFTLAGTTLSSAFIGIGWPH